MMALSVMLLTLAWSTSNSHTSNETEHAFAHEISTFTDSEKLLDINRLWFISVEYGGGFVVTDKKGQILNKVSEQHLLVYLIYQSILITLITVATLVIIVLLASSNNLRLVAVTALIILIVLKSQIPFLFTASINISAPIVTSLYVFTILSFMYWFCNKWLVKNSHTSETLIAYASQSGSAMSLAKRFKKALLHTSDIRCFSMLEPTMLKQYSEVLIVASTYGEGKPPEKAQRFMQKLLAIKEFDESVNYSILALGDSDYPNFCAFGHELEQQLSLKGANAIIDLIEVDRLDSDSINAWWHKITRQLKWLTSDIEQTYASLLVTDNLCLNPPQTHRHVHVVRFNSHHLEYQPGDLLEVLPKRSIEQSRSVLNSLGFNGQEKVIIAKNKFTLLDAFTQLEWQGEKADNAQSFVDKLQSISPRVYSISSSPLQDHIELVVRRHCRPDGHPGLASNYLCDLTLDETVNANIRVHSNFHLPAHDVPLILIGAGTGIAPLIGFLRHRESIGSSQRHWLFFGEQHQNSDYYFANEIKQLNEQNLITALNLAWSRDDNPSYVGEHIKQTREQLIHWVLELGAYIYVCGKRSGFGDSVNEELIQVFGVEQFKELVQSGRIRTDLY